MNTRHRLANGFLWLGSSALVSQLVDSVCTIAVLWFVTREEMGLATLAWSVAVVLEALNGLGVASAIVQSPELSRRQLSSLFWYVLGVSVVLVALASAASPFIARAYGRPEIAPMVIVASSKLLLVGTALVPLQLLNRALDFRRVGMITACATLFAAVARVLLAAVGFGAWALIVASVSHGGFVCLFVYLVAPFRPDWVFKFTEIRRLTAFGAKIAASAVVYHFYRNADFLLVGRYLGMQALGVYRVAFDLPMGIATAILNVVNRAALPVYARVARDPQELARTFHFTARSITLLVSGILAIIWASAPDLLLLLGKGQWIAAAPVVRVLCVAAWLRCLAQTFPPLFNAAGRPAFVLYDSVLSLIVMVGAFAGSLQLWGDRVGVIVISYAWLASYPVLLGFEWAMARSVIPLRVGAYLRALLPAVDGVALLVGAFVLFEPLRRTLRPGVASFTATVAAGALVYAAYLGLGLKLTPRRLLARASDS
ncbi:MAG: lipopolysaccharide biosynthesis protein [Polyangiaceae bacterium]|nr:lipopolysaccharide biosynthesis protein [Polyangiaceae bacterium]